MLLGEEESVLFREVSLFQGCPYMHSISMYIHVQYASKKRTGTVR